MLEVTRRVRHPALRILDHHQRLLGIPATPLEQPGPGHGNADVFARAGLEPIEQSVGGGDRPAAHEAASDQQAGRR